MKLLAREISLVLIEEFGTEEFLKRLSDPFWFQSFGCVLGFDWHSCGITTTVCGALKEGLKNYADEFGLYICGGKGAASLKTPFEIEKIASYISIPVNALIYASKMAAKVDNTALLDGYQLYHHTFVFTKKGDWAVIQQGKNDRNRFARRYHWLKFYNEPKSFIDEPHSGIASYKKEKQVINLVARESDMARQIVTEIARNKPETTIKQLTKIQNLSLPRNHEIRGIKTENLSKILIKSYEQQPKNFQRFLSIKGVGPKTIRALSLISELIYGVKPSFLDPAKFSFAHGGKDGIPYPVDTHTYQQSVEILSFIIQKAKIGDREKINALRRLAS